MNKDSMVKNRHDTIYCFQFKYWNSMELVAFNTVNVAKCNLGDPVESLDLLYPYGRPIAIKKKKVS